MIDWDLNKFRKQIVLKYGDKQLKLLDPFLNSIVEKQHYCSYHYHEAKKLEEACFGDGVTSDDKFLFAFGFSSGETEWSDRDTSYLNIRANLSACLFRTLGSSYS